MFPLLSLLRTAKTDRNCKNGQALAWDTSGLLARTSKLKGLTHGEEVSGDFLAGADPNELAMTCKTYSNIIALFFYSKYIAKIF